MSTSTHLPHEPVWIFHTVPEQPVRALAAACELPLPLARILYQRGYTTPEAAQQFMNPLAFRHPEPTLMSDMQQGVDRIVRAIRNGERIVVYGDYDVDGQASTALLVSALRSLGAAVTYYIPNRLEEGYGLSCDAIRTLAPSTDLLITVDCGITSVDEVALAAQLGVDCVITDHHEPGPMLPAAAAVINPKRDGCAYPDKQLAGCGVAYKLVCGLLQACGRDMSEAEAWLDLVALATIADVVPLVGENRALVVKGLPRFQYRVGLRALCEVAGVDPTNPKAGQVAFSVAPRLNAAGRLDDASIGVQLLLTTDANEAKALAEDLDRQNRERQDVESRIVQEAQDAIEHNPELAEGRALVVAGKGWHRGVIGIVASRLVESYGRPTLVLAVDGDEAVGSGRSIGPFNLYEALSRFRHYFTRFGGHSMAAGLSMPAAALDGFRKDFVHFANASLTDTDLAPLVRVEAVVDPAELSLQLSEMMGAMAPYGVGNPEPVVLVPDTLVCESRRIGRDQSHWRMAVRVPGVATGTVGGIGFGMADRYAERVAMGDRIDIACTLGVNEWNGERLPQLGLRDVRVVTDESGAVLESLWAGPVPSANEWSDPVPTLGERADGTAVGVYDWRGLDGDARPQAFRVAAKECDALLVWTHAPGRQGLLSRVVLGPEDGRTSEAFICSEHIPQVATKRKRAALLFWSIPSSDEALASAVDQAMSWADRLDVHLTFTSSVLAEAHAACAREIPDLEALRHLYRAVYERVRGGKGNVHLSEMTRTLQHRDVSISEGGVKFGLEVFCEAGLIRLQDNGGQVVEVTMEPTNGRKVDLTQALRYNEGITQRERFSGYLTQIASLTGADLLGLSHCSVVGA